MKIYDTARYFTQKQQKQLQVMHRAMLAIARGIEARCVPYDYTLYNYIAPNFKQLQMGNKLYLYTEGELRALKTLFYEVQDVLKTGATFFGLRQVLVDRLYNLLLDPETRKIGAIEGVYYRIRPLSSLLVTREPMSKITDPLKLWIEDVSDANRGYELYATLAYDDKTNKIVIEKHTCSEQALKSQEADHLQTALDTMLTVLGNVGTSDSYERIDTGASTIFEGIYTGARSVFADMVWHRLFIFHAVLDNLISFKG